MFVFAEKEIYHFVSAQQTAQTEEMIQIWSNSQLKRRGGGAGHYWPPGAGNSGPPPTVSPLSSLTQTHPRPAMARNSPSLGHLLRGSRRSAPPFETTGATVLGVSGKRKELILFPLRSSISAGKLTRLGRVGGAWPASRMGGKQDTAALSSPGAVTTPSTAFRCHFLVSKVLDFWVLWIFGDISVMTIVTKDPLVLNSWIFRSF